MKFDIHEGRVEIGGPEIDAFLEMFYFSDRLAKGAIDRPIWRATEYPEDDVRNFSGASFHGIIYIMTRTARHNLEGVSESTYKVAWNGLRQLVGELRAARPPREVKKPKISRVRGRLGRLARGESA